ncbi:MAG: serine/threonine-protein phosphatase [Butyrivibrio sp.]|nr:serine/threonine-protein phosphatase [Butyrivibrio sp.]
MSLTQIIHITFELWSAAFCGIAIICVLATRYQDRRKSKLLGYQLLCNALLNLFEVLAYYFRGNTSELGYYMVRISNFMVFFLTHIMLLLATNYICYRMGNKGGKGTELTRRTVRTICIVGIIMLVLSRFVGFYYAFDEQNRYYRLNESYWIMLAIQITGALVLTVFTVFHWNKLKTLEKIAYLSYELLPILAIGFQAFIYGISLSTFASTYSVLLMFVVYVIEYSERTVSEKQRIQSELLLAKSIQTAMLPHAFPLFPDRKEFDIYATMDPAREVGGDFYDLFMIDDDHLCMVIADVSGKGIPAALFMTVSKTILKSCAMLGNSASEILRKTNEGLTKDNQTGMFVTVWVGIIELSTGKISCSNAGHEYPAIMRKGGTFGILKDKHGFVLGGMPDMPYREYTIQLEHGDRLFLYTDGVPEATDRNNRMYGTDRMIAALNRTPNESPKKILETVRADINSFVKDAEQFDDLTMVCMEYI